jgi:hypothetical protein
MEVGVELTITPMRVQHDDVATFEALPAEIAKELVHTADPTAHEVAQQDVGIIVEGGA